MKDSASQSDYLAAYLGLTWQADLDAGLRTWLEAFQEALDNWQDDVCQRLLREIKQAPLTPEVEGLVRYVEGRWAEQRGDLEHAVRSYQASLELNREAEAVLRMAQVLGDLGLAHQALGRLSKAAESLRSALAIYRVATETDAIFEVLNDLGSVLTSQGNWSEARACLDEALDRSVDATDRATTLANLGVWYQAQGRSTEAEEHFQQALENFRTANAQSNVASVLNNLGVLALDQRRPEEAATHLTEALVIYQSLGDWPNMVRMVGNLALLAQESGNAEEALRHYTEAIESVGDLADARTIAILYNHRALLHADALAWEAAAADLEQSLNHLEQSGDQPTRADVLNNLGTAHRHLGRLDESLACYEQALALAEQLDDRQRIGEITGNLGHLYDLRDDQDAALSLYQTARSLAQQLHDPVMEAVALIGLCTLAWQQGDLATLELLLDETWELGKATDQPDVLARVCWLRGDIALLREDTAQLFQQYAASAAYSASAGEPLLMATLERIDMHADLLTQSGRQGELAAAGQLLQRTWAEAGLLVEFPELHVYLGPVQSLTLTTALAGPAVSNRADDRKGNFKHTDNFVIAYHSGGETQPKGLPFPADEIQMEPQPGAWTLSGQFTGPVAAGSGDAIDLQGAQGTILNPSETVKQYNIRMRTARGLAIGDSAQVHNYGAEVSEVDDADDESQ